VIPNWVKWVFIRLRHYSVLLSSGFALNINIAGPSLLLQCVLLSADNLVTTSAAISVTLR